MQNNNLLSKIISNRRLSSKLSNESSQRSIEIIDGIIYESEKSNGNIFTNIDFLRKAKTETENFLKNGYNMGKFSLLVPVGVWGLSHGFGYPDLDISVMGIGYHRFFLFHSAIGLVGLRYFYKQWLLKHGGDNRFISRVKRKVTGTLLSSYAVGVGLHLAVDVFQPKSIVFPFFGSLVNGTLVDDNIWLIGNSLWALKIGHDVFSLTMADELEAAKKFVKEKFGESFKFSSLKEAK